MRGRLAAGVLAVVLGACASASAEPPPCNKRTQVLELLSERYQEAPIAIGVTSGGGLVEVLTEPDGKTWTIIITTPQGMSCLVLFGEGWRSFEPEPTGPQA